MLHAHLAIFAFVAITLGASGCGGSTKTSSQVKSAAETTSPSQSNPPVQTIVSTGAAPLTRVELVARTNTICQRLNKSIAATNHTVRGSQVNHDLNRAEIVKVVRGRAIAQQKELAELAKLTPPGELASDWQQFVNIRRTLAKTMVSLGEDSEFHNLAGERLAYGSLEGLQRLLTATATRNGFSSCSQVN